MTKHNNTNNKSIEYLKDNNIIQTDEHHLMDISLMTTHKKIAIITLCILLIVAIIPIGFLWYIFGANPLGLIILILIVGGIFSYSLFKILKNTKQALDRSKNTHYFITSKRVYFNHDITGEYTAVNIDDIEYIEVQIERKTHMSKKGKKYPIDTFNNLLFKLKDNSEIIISKINRQPLEDNAELLNTTFGTLFRQRIIPL